MKLSKWGKVSVISLCLAVQTLYVVPAWAGTDWLGNQEKDGGKAGEWYKGNIGNKASG